MEKISPPHPRVER